MDASNFSLERNFIDHEKIISQIDKSKMEKPYVRNPGTIFKKYSKF